MNRINDIKKELSKDKEIALLIKEMSDDEVLFNYANLSSYHENKMICDSCRGESCALASSYRNMVLKKNGFMYDVVYKKCKYAKPNNKGVLTKYFINDLKNDEDVYMNKERAAVYKDLLRFKSSYSKGKKVKGTYIYGACGTGKTYILLNFAKQLVDEGLDVIFAYYPDLNRTIKSSIGDNIEEIIVELKNVDVLMLDDVGAENNTPYVRDEVLGPILQYRMDNYLPVFMTSNQNIELLSQHFKETSNESDLLKSTRIIERILSLMEPVELDDKDYRKN